MSSQGAYGKAGGSSVRPVNVATVKGLRPPSVICANKRRKEE